jgi:hypothetical protein
MSLPSLLRLPVLVLAVLACALPGARSQEQPKLRFTLVATEADDKDAFTAARRWFTDAKTDKDRQAALARLAGKGEAPPVPTEVEVTPARRTTDKDLAALSAAAVPVLGPGDLLLGAALAGRPEKDVLIPAVMRKLPHAYRWGRLSDAEGKALGLANAAAVTQARQAGEAVVLPRTHSLIWSRAGRAPEAAAEYFVLLREQPADQAVTEAALERVRALPGDVAPSLGVKLNKAGADRFKDFTTANKAHLVALELNGQVARIVRLDESIDDGIFYLNGIPQAAEVRELAAQLQRLVPEKPKDKPKGPQDR